MLQLKDHTPFVSSLELLPDEQGVETLFVVVRASFTIGDDVSGRARLSVAEEQQPVRLEDEYEGEPGESSLRYASDVHLCKPATDVALVGHAFAPDGREVTELMTQLSVGPVTKTIDVIGDREYTGRSLGASLTRPRPFTRVPLVYERAYGGHYVASERKGKVASEPRNPVGTGLAARKRRAELAGRLAPNLLDPGDATRPASYGFTAPSWEPRASFAGTYDEAWQRTRAPFLPHDFDPRYFCAAHPDLTCPGHLEGGEAVGLKNLSPRGDLRFALPRADLEVSVAIAGRRETPRPRLETVLLQPEIDHLALTYRASLPCSKQALKIEAVDVTLNALDLG